MLLLMMTAVMSRLCWMHGRANLATGGNRLYLGGTRSAGLLSQILVREDYTIDC